MKRTEIDQASNLFRRRDTLEAQKLQLQGLHREPLSGRKPVIHWMYGKPTKGGTTDDKVYIEVDMETFKASVDAQIAVIDKAIEITNEQLVEMGVEP